MAAPSRRWVVGAICLGVVLAVSICIGLALNGSGFKALEGITWSHSCGTFGGDKGSRIRLPGVCTDDSTCIDHDNANTEGPPQCCQPRSDGIQRWLPPVKPGDLLTPNSLSPR